VNVLGDEITIGKPLDVLALKGSSLDDIRNYAAHLARTAASLYPRGGENHVLQDCPCCGASALRAPVAVEINGVAYHRCPACGHGFVRDQPLSEVLERHLVETEELAAAYIDPSAVEVRLDQVVLPKVSWTLDVFARHAGGVPSRAVDVGAGGGHFVEGLRRAGIEAVGYELSTRARAFARKTFGIHLRAEDFGAAGETADLVTFWGLLEYVPEPRRLLGAARAALAEGGLLVVEVPRLDCLGTAVQACFSNTVARHLDPTSHVNCFSDESLAAALTAAGFRPVAAWYFGMDAYELAVQLALRLGDEALGPLVDLLLPLQRRLDATRYCDDVVVAAVPVR